MSDEYVFKPSGALGNILIQLTSMQKECTKLHDSVYEYEFSNCITIKGFTRVSYLGKIPESPIFINPYTIRNVHPRIRDIIEPTSYMGTNDPKSYSPTKRCIVWRFNSSRFIQRGF